MLVKAAGIVLGFGASSNSEWTKAIWTILEMLVKKSKNEDNFQFSLSPS